MDRASVGGKEKGMLYRNIFAVTATHWAPVKNMLETLWQVEMQLFRTDPSPLSSEEKMPYASPTHTHIYMAFLLPKAYPVSLSSKS